jgi:hypothetical protein
MRERALRVLGAAQPPASAGGEAPAAAHARSLSRAASRALPRRRRNAVQRDATRAGARAHLKAQRRRPVERAEGGTPPAPRVRRRAAPSNGGACVRVALRRAAPRTGACARVPVATCSVLRHHTRGAVRAEARVSQAVCDGV